MTCQLHHHPLLHHLQRRSAVTVVAAPSHMLLVRLATPRYSEAEK